MLATASGMVKGMKWDDTDESTQKRAELMVNAN